MIGSFLFLGTSASSGVPMIGCQCAVCQSASPFNHRLRPAGLIRLGGKSLLIDAGPDLRLQALKYEICHLDGLLLTHTHFDHIAGIDELRVFYFPDKKPFPCLLSRESYEDIKIRYPYFFRSIGEGLTLSAQFDFEVLEYPTGLQEFQGIKIRYCSYSQGGMKVLGYRLGDFAYVSDIRQFDESIFSFLKGVEKLVLGALKPESSPVHFSFEEAISFANRAGVRETWLTHLGHHIDHEEACALLPPSVRISYDGLELKFNYDTKEAYGRADC